LALPFNRRSASSPATPRSHDTLADGTWSAWIESGIGAIKEGDGNGFPWLRTRGLKRRSAARSDWHLAWSVLPFRDMGG